MSLIRVTIKHGRTLDEAKLRLDQAVSRLKGQFGALIRSAEWSPGRDSVRLSGPGIQLDLLVDPTDVHVSGDIPFLAGLLGTSRLKQIVESTFR